MQSHYSAKSPLRVTRLWHLHWMIRVFAILNSPNIKISIQNLCKGYMSLEYNCIYSHAGCFKFSSIYLEWCTATWTHLWGVLPGSRYLQVSRSRSASGQGFWFQLWPSFRLFCPQLLLPFLPFHLPSNVCMTHTPKICHLLPRCTKNKSIFDPFVHVQ